MAYLNISHASKHGISFSHWCRLRKIIVSWAVILLLHSHARLRTSVENIMGWLLSPLSGMPSYPLVFVFQLFGLGRSLYEIVPCTEYNTVS